MCIRDRCLAAQVTVTSHYATYGPSPHRYAMQCFKTVDGDIHIIYGCRSKTLSEAREHWHPNNYYGDPEVVDWTNEMLDRMESRAE